MSEEMGIVNFILEAKLSGYATGGESQELKFEDGSKGFNYESNEYKYIDRYFGFNPFSGTEHLFTSDSRLIWKMNYYGLVFPDTSDSKMIYSFLSDAMSLITEEYPFRGPHIHENGILKYVNNQNGTLDCFNGIEIIYEGTKKVYELYYHGGTLKQNT